MIRIRMFTRRGQLDFHKALKSFLSIGEAEFKWAERDLTENLNLTCCPIDQTLESSKSNTFSGARRANKEPKATISSSFKLLLKERDQERVE